MNIIRSFTLVFLLQVFMCSGQDSNDQEKDFKHHKIMLVLGHTFIYEVIDADGSKELVALASWGLDYDYRFNEKWALGLHSDMVLENFEFEDGEGAIFERSSPIALIVAGSRKLGEHFTVMTGAGMEFAKEEHLAVIRVGADYGWEIMNDWEIAASLMFDFKIDGYNSAVFGFGVGKSF